MYDVVALGELLVDFTYEDSSADGYPVLAAHPGGAPANFLSALSKYGAKTAFLGKVGNDAFGRLLITSLHEVGIETKGIVMSENVFTTLAFVTLDKNGEREFSFARKPGADTSLQFSDIDLSLIDKARVFHFGSLSLTDEPARTTTCRVVEYAKANGKLITYDPNFRKTLWKNSKDAMEQIVWGLAQADVVKISDEEIQILFDMRVEEGAQHILNTYGVKLVFVTCGAEGCYFRNPVAEGKVSCPTDIQVVDTTGAGDIFGGSAIWKLLQNAKVPELMLENDLREIVTFACTSASLSTTRSGGIPSVPKYEEILAAMRQ